MTTNATTLWGPQKYQWLGYTDELGYPKGDQWVVGDDNVVWHSPDGGATWQELAAPPEEQR